MIYKIIEREPMANRVIQIHEVYSGHVGAKVQEIIDQKMQVGVTATLTISAVK
jgi:hypothetical protein